MYSADVMFSDAITTAQISIVTGDADSHRALHARPVSQLRHRKRRHQRQRRQLPRAKPDTQQRKHRGITLKHTKVKRPQHLGAARVAAKPLESPSLPSGDQQRHAAAVERGGRRLPSGRQREADGDEQYQNSLRPQHPPYRARRRGIGVPVRVWFALKMRRKSPKDLFYQQPKSAIPANGGPLKGGEVYGQLTWRVNIATGLTALRAQSTGRHLALLAAGMASRYTTLLRSRRRVGRGRGGSSGIGAVGARPLLCQAFRLLDFVRF